MAEPTGPAPDLNELRKQFTSYATAKANEIDESREAWRYYHVAQLTAQQREVYKKRGQPAIIFDRISRKVDGLVGVIRKLRTDPKAFPQSQKHEAGAEIATQTVRTVLDASTFEDLEAEAARDAGVHGFAVSSLRFVTSDTGDPDIGVEYVDPRTYFYDPRSVDPLFKDRRFDGTYKWADIDEIEEMVPGARDLIGAASDDGTYSTAFDADRENLWIDDKGRHRLVDHWYIKNGTWMWCLHVGSAVLQHGSSPFFDKNAKTINKFFPVSNLIDHDGDRYGYIRRLKGPQDAMNQHRSKALHIMNTRQLFLRKGVVEDMEKARQQVARPDGVVEHNGVWGQDIIVDQPNQEFLQQTQYYQDAKNEIDQFGPNAALIGDLGKSASGRAYAIAQQAGLSELGPFLKNQRIWKLEQYKAIWCAAQRYWTAERWIRVNDPDEEEAKFFQINALGLDQYGRPALVNALGTIDVDILFDEGPDTETVMGDVFDTLSALAQNGVPVPPQVIIEVSTLPGRVKKKLIGMMEQPDPMKEKAAQVELAGQEATAFERQTRGQLNLANARKAMTPEAPTPGAPQPQELPMGVQIEEALANIRHTDAQTTRELATARKTTVEASLAPQRAANEAAARQARASVPQVRAQ
jgi:hypothetical protein